MPLNTTQASGTGVMDVKHKGAWAETLAKAYLLQQGFEVFGNASSHGPVDFVAMDPDTGAIALYDVKLGTVVTWKIKGGFERSGVYHFPVSKMTNQQRKLGVQLLHVTPDGRVLTQAEVPRRK